jgi:hypothetical protein
VGAQEPSLHGNGLWAHRPRQPPQQTCLAREPTPLHAGQRWHCLVAAHSAHAQASLCRVPAARQRCLREERPQSTARPATHVNTPAIKEPHKQLTHGGKIQALNSHDASKRLEAVAQGAGGMTTTPELSCWPTHQVEQASTDCANGPQEGHASRHAQQLCAANDVGVAQSERGPSSGHPGML